MLRSARALIWSPAVRVVVLGCAVLPTLAQAQQPAGAPASAATPAIAAPTNPAARLADKPSLDVGHAAGAPTHKDAAAAKAGLSAGQWPPEDVSAAQHACVALLKDLEVVAVGASPMREGDCGAPAPIELISVGRSPQVTFSPPVVVTCDMAAALHKWVTGDLQVLAKKHLGAPLIRIETMSSYSCRNAYGRAKGRLSEHGKANAIDIRAFLTAKAEPTDVMSHWGPTERDIAAAQVAAKAEAERQKALAAQQAKPAPGQPALAGTNPVATGTAPTGVADAARPSVVIGIPGAAQPFPSSSPSAIGLSAPFPQPNRLGGPKPPATPLRGTTAIDQTSGRMQFLKGAHSSACRIFGTVLGPEANNAHRNHFHVDMARRTGSSFCE
jgi:hypothetical protein